MTLSKPSEVHGGHERWKDSSPSELSHSSLPATESLENPESKILESMSTLHWPVVVPLRFLRMKMMILSGRTTASACQPFLRRQLDMFPCSRETRQTLLRPPREVVVLSVDGPSDLQQLLGQPDGLTQPSVLFGLVPPLPATGPSCRRQLC